jgi:hypothetical protein
LEFSTNDSEIISIHNVESNDDLILILFSSKLIILNASNNNNNVSIDFSQSLSSNLYCLASKFETNNQLCLALATIENNQLFKCQSTIDISQQQQQSILMTFEKSNLSVDNNVTCLTSLSIKSFLIHSTNNVILTNFETDSSSSSSSTLLVTLPRGSTKTIVSDHLLICEKTENQQQQTLQMIHCEQNRHIVPLNTIYL